MAVNYGLLGEAVSTVKKKADSAQDRTFREALCELYGALNDPDVSRPNINGKHGDEFRRRQYRSDCLFNAFIENFVSAAPGMSSAEDAKWYLRRVREWKDADREIFD